jgi:hypothetical protein
MITAPTFRPVTQRRIAVLAAPLLLALGACAPASATATQTFAINQARSESRQSYILSGAVLQRSDTRTLLDLVNERWPGMVRGDLPRGAGLRFGAAPPSAYPDRFGVYDTRGAFLGGPEYLASMRPSDVQQLRRLTDMEENAKFGRSHPAGAVIVTWVNERVRP